MKKRFLIVVSFLLVFGLVAVAVAYNRTSNSPQQDTASAAGQQSCSMHKQAATDSTGKHEGSCCGDCCKDGKCSMGGACCKDKDACPMKQKNDSATTTTAGGGESCCQKGADCCKGGGAACCKHKS